MFKRYLFAALLCWIVIVVFCIWVFHAPSPEDEKRYQCLMNCGDHLQKEMEASGRPIRQTREHVSKQILYKKETQRLETRIDSDHSDLVIKTKQDGAELVECFKGITCLMQEKLVEEDDLSQCKQYLRFLKAQEAFYSYKNSQLTAENVEMAHFLVPQHALPNSLEEYNPLLRGYAKTFHFTLSKEPIAKAEKFRMVFNSLGDE